MIINYETSPNEEGDDQLNLGGDSDEEEESDQ